MRCIWLCSEWCNDFSAVVAGIINSVDFFPCYWNTILHRSLKQSVFKISFCLGFLHAFWSFSLLLHSPMRVIRNSYKRCSDPKKTSITLQTIIRRDLAYVRCVLLCPYNCIALKILSHLMYCLFSNWTENKRSNLTV